MQTAGSQKFPICNFGLSIKLFCVYVKVHIFPGCHIKKANNTVLFKSPSMCEATLLIYHYTLNTAHGDGLCLNTTKQMRVYLLFNFLPFPDKD